MLEWSSTGSLILKIQQRPVTPITDLEYRTRLVDIPAMEADFGELGSLHLQEEE